MQQDGQGIRDVAAAPSLAGIARRGYTIGVYLLGLAVLVQFLLAGVGILADPGFLPWHSAAGASVIFVLSLLLVAVGALARVPGRTLWITASVAGLVILQSALLVPYHMSATGLLRAVSGLHVLNALLVFWVVLKLLDRTPRRMAGTRVGLPAGRTAW